VVFDSPTPTFRHKQYPEYKATRQKAPEDLHVQVPLVEEVLAALGVPAYRLGPQYAERPPGAWSEIIAKNSMEGLSRPAMGLNITG
jgi:5'-3' exonuclease